MGCIVGLHDEITGLRRSRVKAIIDAQPALHARDEMEVGTAVALVSIEKFPQYSPVKNICPQDCKF
jgi:hypothetical protein